jgi:thymidylate synthase (FAD)
MTTSSEPSVPIKYRSDVTVELVKHSASDSDVVWAARVSTAGEQKMLTQKNTQV